MRNLIVLPLLLLLGTSDSPCQQTPNLKLNLSFEMTSEKGTITGCTFPWASNDYFSYKDDSVKIDGNNSLRLEKDTASKKGGYGTIMFFLPANFKGKEVTLKGYIKTENVQDGYAGLWLRSDDGDQSSVGFENMSDQGIVGTTEWKQYSISVPMNDDVTSIVFGGLLVGKGKTWFDKLELLIDDKPVETVAWMPGKIKPRRNELTASAVKIDSTLTNQQKENLYVLGKVWGFLKYHHPDVAKGDYDFDSCLFNIMPVIVGAKNLAERDEAIIKWINTLGDENKYPAQVVKDTSTIHTKPDLGWLDDKRLFSHGVSKRLNNIYQHRNAGSNYYVKMAKGVGNPVFDKEAIYKYVSSYDDGFRMLALFRFWNMVEYFFPYKHLFKEKWTDVLKEFIPQFASNRSSITYRLTSFRLINRVHDTHASIYSDSTLRNHFGNKGPALDFKMLGGKVIVTGVLSDSLAAFETLAKGDEIVTVNGKKIADLRKEAEPYLCASNESVADRNFLDRFLFRSNQDFLEIRYKRNGKTDKATMRLYAASLYRNGDNADMPMYKLLDPEIGYISLGKIKTDSLSAIFKKFKNTKGVVIDIRNYPAQFVPFALAEYIKAGSTPFVKFTVGDINNPGTFTFTPSINNGPEKGSDADTYKGSIVILVNEQSQSQAEYTTMALRTGSRAVVMGSQTAGADGNVSYIPFPGGFNTMYSGIGVFYPDGKETQGIGIVPDVEVKPTQKGFAEGKDEVLEKAKEYIRKTKAF